MAHIVNLYKYKGETPLEALERLRNLPEYKEEILSYAGRLDPMAEGVMLVLVGDANKKREDYLGLDKEYEVEILQGIETDTYDVLGISTLNTTPGPSLEKEGKIQDLLKSCVGTFSQFYPPYSSKPVNGKPLFQWAREGRLHEIMVPTKQVTIYSIELINEKIISQKEILHDVKNSVENMKGDFRQREIIDSWNKNLSQNSYEIVKIKVCCSSGTYMRSLAHSIGKKVQSSALAYSIKRTKVGNYSIEESMRL